MIIGQCQVWYALPRGVVNALNVLFQYILFRHPKQHLSHHLPDLQTAQYRIWGELILGLQNRTICVIKLIASTMLSAPTKRQQSSANISFFMSLYASFFDEICKPQWIMYICHPSNTNQNCEYTIAMVLTRRQNIWCYTAQHTTRRGGSHGQISTIKGTQDAYGASWRRSGR